MMNVINIGCDYNMESNKQGKVVILTGNEGIGKSTAVIRSNGNLIKFPETARKYFNNKIRRHSINPEKYREDYILTQYRILQIDTKNLVAAFRSERDVLLDRSVESVFYYTKKWHKLDISGDWVTPAKLKISRKEFVVILGTYGLSKEEIELYRKSINLMIIDMPFVDFRLVEVKKNNTAIFEVVSEILGED
jgi:hypothetical protein